MVADVGLVGVRERDVAFARDGSEGMDERERGMDELAGDRANALDDRRSFAEREKPKPPPSDRRVDWAVAVVCAVEVDVLVAVDDGGRVDV